MSAIPLRGRSTQIYGDAVALGTHTSNNHGLFEGDELFKESPIEDLDDQVYILRRYNGEPIAHMPVNNNTCPRCAEQGIEQYVMPGKHCPRCNQPC